MEKFKNRFRINTARLPNWDYGRNGCYFITINTDEGNHYFGNIENGKMHLSNMGEIANEIWLTIPDQFPYAILHNHIIMPNHMHGIIEISKNPAPHPEPEPELEPVKTRFIASPDPESAPDPVKTRFIASPSEKRFIASPSETGGTTGANNPMLQQNLPRILRWYKGRCTFEIRKTHPHFKWHTRYHDRIIRNEKTFYNIQKYIENNPLKWWEEKC